MSPRFVDSHAHLDGDVLHPQLPQVLDRAREAGLTDIICIGASDGFDSNPKTLEVAERHDGIHATVGIHPHDAREVDDEVIEKIRLLADHPKVVAIGEMGLDYYYDSSPREAQQDAFRRFLAIAREVNKPIVVHTRDAEDDTLAILKDEGADEMGGVIHCFTGTEKLATGALDLGFYISFSGVLTFRNAESLRSIAADLPRDKVLVETDCPYLAPVPKRGKTNEPSYVIHTAGKLAELWNQDLEEVKTTTGENAVRLFGLETRPSGLRPGADDR